MAELVAKAERRTGQRGSAVTLANHWCDQIIDSGARMTKAEAAAYILRQLEDRQRARACPAP